MHQSEQAYTRDLAIRILQQSDDIEKILVNLPNAYSFS
ncbi:hypothetical protein T633_1097 [Acinetobacter baumannii MRSN 58]|nr:hypothetical protein T633_1097 [Acinetobacter baumannii MRSN 58]